MKLTGLGLALLCASCLALASRAEAGIPAYVTNANGTTVPVQATFEQSTIFWNGATGSGSALAGSATFTGASRDVGVAAATLTNQAYFNAFFYADQAGTAYVDCSNDNSTWYVCATNALTASTPLILTVPVMTRYHRARLVNGSSAETYLWVNTSYTGA